MCLAALAGSAQAQRLPVREASVGGIAVAARRDFWGLALGAAHRPGGQARFALAVAAGASGPGGGLATRLEATAQFLVSPAARAGANVYGGVGVAFAGARAARGAGYLIVLVGLESAAGRARGWYVELGLGGGVRAAAGRRWRRFPAWW